MTAFEIPVIVRQPLTPVQVGRLRELGCQRVTLLDDSLPHQIRLTWLKRDGHGSTHHIAVSCTCLRIRRPRGPDGWEPIEARPCWQPGEAIERWRQHVAEAEAGAGVAL